MACKTPIWVILTRADDYKTQFCSKTCTDVWQRRNRKFFDCEFCGKNFWVTQSVAKTRPHGIRYCSRKCCHSDPAHKERVFESLRLKVQTKLETAGYTLLDSEGVIYRRQCTMFGKWCVDAFVPSAKLIIQFDGDYWHGNPARFPTLTPKQDRQRRMDRGQDNYVQKHGYRMLRIWERDMYKRFNEVKKRLCAALTG